MAQATMAGRASCKPALCGRGKALSFAMAAEDESAVFCETDDEVPRLA